MMIGSGAMELLDLFVDADVKIGISPRERLGACSLYEGDLRRGLRCIGYGRALTLRPYSQK